MADYRGIRSRNLWITANLNRKNLWITAKILFIAVIFRYLFTSLFYGVDIGSAGFISRRKLQSSPRSFSNRAFQRQRNVAGRKYPLHARLLHDIFGFTRGIGDSGVLVLFQIQHEKSRHCCRLLDFDYL